VSAWVYVSMSDRDSARSFLSTQLSFPFPILSWADFLFSLSLCSLSLTHHTHTLSLSIYLFSQTILKVALWPIGRQRKNSQGGSSTHICCKKRIGSTVGRHIKTHGGGIRKVLEYIRRRKVPGARLGIRTLTVGGRFQCPAGSGGREEVGTEVAGSNRGYSSSPGGQ
jgi:hypothetical protein